MAKFCTNCGKEIPEGAVSCPGCGAATESEVVPAQTTATTTVNVNVAQPKQTNGMALAGFITSLVSSILCCGTFNLISLILSIVGLVKSKNVGGAGKGFSIAGIIISLLGLILFLLFVFVYAAILLEAISYGY